MLKLHNWNDLGKALDPLAEGVLDNRTEPFGKAQELRRRQRLIAKEDHAVFEPGAPHGANHLLTELTGEVDAVDFGSNPPGDRSHLKSWLGHGRLCPSFNASCRKTPNTAWLRR